MHIYYIIHVLYSFTWTPIAKAPLNYPSDSPNIPNNPYNPPLRLLLFQALQTSDPTSSPITPFHEGSENTTYQYHNIPDDFEVTIHLLLSSSSDPLNPAVDNDVHMSSGSPIPHQQGLEKSIGNERERERERSQWLSCCFQLGSGLLEMQGQNAGSESSDFLNHQFYTSFLSFLPPSLSSQVTAAAIYSPIPHSSMETSGGSNEQREELFLATASAKLLIFDLTELSLNLEKLRIASSKSNHRDSLDNPNNPNSPNSPSNPSLNVSASERLLRDTIQALDNNNHRNNPSRKPSNNPLYDNQIPPSSSSSSSSCPAQHRELLFTERGRLVAPKWVWDVPEAACELVLYQGSQGV